MSIDGYEDVPTSEPALLKAVAGQPVAVAICASERRGAGRRGGGRGPMEG